MRKGRRAVAQFGMIAYNQLDGKTERSRSEQRKGKKRSSAVGPFSRLRTAQGKDSYRWRTFCFADFLHWDGSAHPCACNYNEHFLQKWMVRRYARVYTIQNYIQITASVSHLNFTKVAIFHLIEERIEPYMVYTVYHVHRLVEVFFCANVSLKYSMI